MRLSECVASLGGAFNFWAWLTVMPAPLYGWAPTTIC